MFIPSFLFFSCSGGEKQDSSTLDTGVDVEDTETEDTSEDTEDTSDTNTDTDDTSDTDTDGTLSGTYRAQSMVQVLHQTTEGEQVSTNVRCLLETDEGIHLQDPASFTLTVSPSEGTTVEDDLVHFTAQGEYEITCSSESDEGSASVQVVGEVLNPMVQATSIAFSEAEMALSDVVISNGSTDEELLMAYHRLQMAKEMLPENLSPFRDIPEAFWPSVEALEEAGQGINVDDQLLDQWIAETGDTIQQILALFAGMDPISPAQTDLDTLDTLDVQLQGHLTQIDQMNPSLLGWKSNEVPLNNVVLEPLRLMLIQSADWHIAQLEGDADEILPPFGLASLTMGMAMKSSLRFRVANQLYGKAIKAIDVMVNNLIAIELLNTLMPPVGNIEVTWFGLSSSTAMIVPGYSNSFIEGNGFSEKPGMNVVYFVTADWQTTIDAALSGCGTGSGNNYLEHLENAQTCLDASSGYGSETPGQSVLNNGIFGGTHTLNLGTLPTDLCTGFWPVPIGVKVWNMETGAQTQYHTLNCIP